MKHLILLSILFNIVSCSDWDGRLVLVNKTDKLIRYQDDLKQKDDFSPDTTKCNVGILYNIRPNSEDRLSRQLNWDVYFRQKPDHVLRIFIVNEDSLKKYGKCKILTDQIIMKRFDLTYDDLKRLQWRVVFDGK